ncbi:MBL fold metallo-hydrolase, partial [Clostridium butyricum]
TDFIGGDMKEIISSIKNKLLPLGDDVEVYPGHGPSSSIKFEKMRNPYL